MKYSLLVFLLVIATSASAQTTKPPPPAFTPGPPAPDSSGRIIYQFVQVMPKSTVDIERFLAEHTNYPDSAKKYRIQGRVAIQFVVNEDGKLSDLKATHSIGYGCEEEAIRVMKMMPPWTPARQEGKKVKAYYTIPFRFQLQ